MCEKKNEIKLTRDWPGEQRGGGGWPDNDLHADGRVRWALTLARKRPRAWTWCKIKGRNVDREEKTRFFESSGPIILASPLPKSILVLDQRKFPGQYSPVLMTDHEGRRRGVARLTVTGRWSSELGKGDETATDSLSLIHVPDYRAYSTSEFACLECFALVTPLCQPHYGTLIETQWLEAFVVSLGSQWANISYLNFEEKREEEKKTRRDKKGDREVITRSLLNRFRTDDLGLSSQTNYTKTTTVNSPKVLLQADVTEAMATRLDHNRIAHGQSTQGTEAPTPGTINELEAVARHLPPYPSTTARRPGRQLRTYSSGTSSSRPCSRHFRKLHKL
ncbi:hypothetical protein RRG08_025824 [Elysia crispata]|uniref:Uncharacterized protein n=1 Tax=Elysia crispata TaxID=231223 RepID=A0AAE0Y302_9GAST|nr:hypothetical protein RRG08_025824 [Elysia crispata]